MIEKHDFEQFKDLVNTKFDAMASILETLRSDLAEEGVKRYKLGQEVERMKHDATKVKGRLGGVEMQVKDFRTEIDELPVNEPQSGHSRIGCQNRYEGEGLEVMQDQLAAALAEIADLSTDSKDQAKVIRNLEARFAGETLPMQAAPHRRQLTAADYAAHLARPNAQPQEEMVSQASIDPALNGVPTNAGFQDLLKSSVQKMMHRDEMKQEIDELFSKDDLCNAWRRLTNGTLNRQSPPTTHKTDHLHIVAFPDCDVPENTVCAAGRFTGTCRELLALRDRVTCRLALFDSYGDALEEARDATMY